MVFLETITGMQLNGDNNTIPYTERHTLEQNAMLLSTPDIKNQPILTFVISES